MRPETGNNVLVSTFQRQERTDVIGNENRAFEMGMVHSAKDVNRILGLSCETEEQVPPFSGDKLIFYYGGWSAQELQATHLGQKRMHETEKGFNHVEPGYYEIMLAVPGTADLNFDEQVAVVKERYPGFEPAPTILALTAFLLEMHCGVDPLGDDQCNCVEVWGEKHASLGVINAHKVIVSIFPHDVRSSRVWMAAIRKVR